MLSVAEGKFVSGFRVLVVESNPADSYLIVEALKQAGLNDGIATFDDSQTALDYLERESAPDLILLDLNLAPLSGFEVLTHIRSHPSLGTTPVVIMSGSQNSRDVKKAYELRANCYICKPTTLDRFLKSMKVSYEFWSGVVTLPPK